MYSLPFRMIYKAPGPVTGCCVVGLLLLIFTYSKFFVEEVRVRPVISVWDGKSRTALNCGFVALNYTTFRILHGFVTCRSTLQIWIW
jgi:hypothetical protein